MDILGSYLIAVNLITFIAFAVDKRNAIHQKRRIRVRTLLGLSFAGGSIGGLLAMYIFRHKTRKPQFVYGLPLMSVVQAAVIIYLKMTGLI